MTRFLRRLARFARRLRAWLPLLWRVEEWDWAHLTALMQLHMSRMAEVISSNDYVESAPKVAQSLRIATECLRRVSDSECYGLRLEAEHEEKWGVVAFESIPIDERYSELRSWYPKAATPKQEAQARQESLDITFYQERRQRRDLQRFCRIFERDLLGWWD